MTHRITAFAALLSMSALAPVHAEEFLTTAAGACRSALPVFDGNMRTRPLGMQNDGASPSFVTCGQQVSLAAGSNFRRASVRLYNTTATPTDVSCTLVDGFTEFNNNQYYPRTVSVPANSGLWVNFDPPAPATLFITGQQTFSCNLPAGTGIARVSITTP